MSKTGLVLSIQNGTALLVTDTGEFVKVKAFYPYPKIGETYTGILKRESNPIKYVIAAVVLFLIFITGKITYIYYTPVATVNVSINPSIELKINSYDKIIKCSPLNNDGKTLLKNIKLKNKNIDTALILVVDEAKNQKFITANYINEGKTILVKVSSINNSKTLKLENFQRYINKNKINTHINNSGKEQKQDFIKNEVPLNNINTNTVTPNKNINKNDTDKPNKNVDTKMDKKNNVNTNSNDNTNSNTENVNKNTVDNKPKPTNNTKDKEHSKDEEKPNLSDTKPKKPSLPGNDHKK